jgi:hypothetical protein
LHPATAETKRNYFRSGIREYSATERSRHAPSMTQNLAAASRLPGNHGDPDRRHLMTLDVAYFRHAHWEPRADAVLETLDDFASILERSSTRYLQDETRDADEHWGDISSVRGSA